MLNRGRWLLASGTTHGHHLGVSLALLGNTALAAIVESEELARVAVLARHGQPELYSGRYNTRYAGEGLTLHHGPASEEAPLMSNAWRDEW